MSGHKHDEALFCGRVTASMTHELKNVLAIIKESCGLMGDLLELSPDADFPHRERFERSMKAILQQVGRGVEISTRLNRFAHSPDSQKARINCPEWVEQMCYLCHRFARLKEVEMELVEPEEAEPATLETIPFLFQMAVFAGIDRFLVTLEPESKLRITWAQTADGVDIQITSSNGLPGNWQGDTPDPMEDLEKIMGQLAAEMIWKQENGELILRFPDSLS